MFIILDGIRINADHIEEYEIDASGCLVIAYYSGRTRRFPPEDSKTFQWWMDCVTTPEVRILEQEYVRDAN